MLTPYKHAALSILIFASLTVTAGCVDENDAMLLGTNEQSIVGGAPESGYSAVAAILNHGEMHCTGTLVRPTIVVTAAHCLVDVRAGNMDVFFGPDIRSPGLKIGVAAIHSHPRYDDFDVVNDIGVIVLTRAADEVDPIPLASNMGSDWVGREALFLGYGVTNADTERAGTKFATRIPITRVRTKTFRYAAAGRNTCFGDSGGPALEERSDGSLALLGVTSWGDEYCEEFGVNTRVDAFGDFISPFLDGATPPGGGGTNDGGDFDDDDFCADEGWYDDLICDEDCPRPDPDCDEDGGFFGEGGDADMGCSATGASQAGAWAIALLVGVVAPLSRRRTGNRSTAV